MKEITIIIEQFSNGLTFRWRDNSGEVDPADRVIINGKEAEEIGNEIFGDIQMVMNESQCNKVRMEIKYKPIEDNEV